MTLNENNKEELEALDLEVMDGMLGRKEWTGLSTMRVLHRLIKSVLQLNNIPDKAQLAKMSEKLKDEKDL